MISDGLRQLGEVSKEYAARVEAYARVTHEAGVAAATYKSEHAKAVVWHKESGERMSMAEAEVRADADEHIGALYLDRMVKEAAEKAAKAKLDQLREQNANGRSYVTTERTGDELHARSAV